jgi:hypothetical protein
VARVLNSSGVFFLNLYSDLHSSYSSGILKEDGFTSDIKEGSLTGVGNLCFYGKKEIDYMIKKDVWQIKSIKHKSVDEYIEAKILRHAECEIVLSKI